MLQLLFLVIDLTSLKKGKGDGIDRMPLREIDNHVREEMDNNEAIAKVTREYHRGLLLRRRRKRTTMTIMVTTMTTTMHLHLPAPPTVAPLFKTMLSKMAMRVPPSRRRFGFCSSPRHYSR